MKQVILALGLILTITGSLLAQKSEVFTTSDGAIRGYDPVAYFMAGKPVKGDAKFSYTWRGASWHFASQQNLDLFKSNPEKYAPQYGGYCAYGTAKGHKAPIDPQAWTVLNGKLYLNYDADVKATWDKDRPGYIQKADKNWGEIKNKD